MIVLERPLTKPEPHKWEFRARFRRHAFGWKSQPPIQLIRQAVAEIRKVARTDPVLGAEGAVLFLERLSPDLEHVDSSSGAIGRAVNGAIAELVPIIASAPADAMTRDAWLDRLWEAHSADGIPYIEALADHWGELCASNEAAAKWADDLLGTTRMALSPDKKLRGFFHGTSACLSALYRAQRYVGVRSVRCTCKSSSNAARRCAERVRRHRSGHRCSRLEPRARKEDALPHRLRSPGGSLENSCVGALRGDIELHRRTVQTSELLCNFRDLLHSCAAECNFGADGTGGDEVQPEGAAGLPGIR